MPDQVKNQDYVCGFAYQRQTSTDMLFTSVLMIRKAKPEWQAGKLNGVGGKIELGEGIRQAMAREFQEETGIDTQPTDWETFHIERFRSGARVYFMHLIDMDPTLMYNAVISTKDAAEPVNMLSITRKDGTVYGHRKDLMYNIKYLLAMSRATLNLPAEHRPIES